MGGEVGIPEEEGEEAAAAAAACVTSEVELLRGLFLDDLGVGAVVTSGGVDVGAAIVLVEGDSCVVMLLSKGDGDLGEGGFGKLSSSL